MLRKKSLGANNNNNNANNNNNNRNLRNLNRVLREANANTNASNTSSKNNLNLNRVMGLQAAALPNAFKNLGNYTPGRRKILEALIRPPSCSNYLPTTTAAFPKCFEKQVAAARASTGESRDCRGFKLHEDQIRVFELAKTFAFGPKDGIDRGQLVWASTGAGKTTIALSIILAYTDTPRDIYVVTTLENQSQNSPDKYFQNMKTFFPQMFQAVKKAYPDLSMYMRRHEAQGDMRARVKFLSLKKFYNFLSGDVAAYGAGGASKILFSPNGSVIIFDEAHRMFDAGNAAKQSASQQKEQLLLAQIGERLLALTPDRLRKMHLWCLTATPGNDVHKWIQLLGVVRRANVPDFSRTHVPTSQLAKFVQGVVTYSDLRHRLDSHACVREVNAVNASDRWYSVAQAYEVGLAVTDKARRDTARQTGLAIKLARISKFFAPDFIEELKKRGRILGPGWWVSNKLVALVHHLQNSPGKVFVYTSNPDLVVMALEHYYGYKDVTSRAVVRGQAFNDPGKHLVVLDKNVTRKAGEGASTTVKERLMEAVNAPGNLRGELIKVVVATGKEFEGSDIKALREIHLVDSLDSALDERQLLGRGVRFCSHAQLPPAERNVAIFRWFLRPTLHHVDETLSVLAAAKAGKKIMDMFDARVRHVAKQWGTDGYDIQAWKELITKKTTVELYNLEQFVVSIAKGKSSPPAASKIFRFDPGTPCV